jgi:hypothetical protein
MGWQQPADNEDIPKRTGEGRPSERRAAFVVVGENRGMQLVVIFGPPAVGKATVGVELARLTGFKLFHNHVSLDAVTAVFDWGSEPFKVLVEEMRLRFIEEAARADVDLIFTFVWAFDIPGDRDIIDSYKAIAEGHLGQVLFVELQALQAVRMQRNGGEDRARMKRRTEESRTGEWIAQFEQGHVFTAPEPFFYPEAFLRVDTTNIRPDEAAQAIIAYFGLVSPEP